MIGLSTFASKELENVEAYTTEQKTPGAPSSTSKHPEPFFFRYRSKGEGAKLNAMSRTAALALARDVAELSALATFVINFVRIRK
jgi:hypothetical protein